MMRPRLVAMSVALASLGLAPQPARADVIFFSGCAQGLPDACILVTLTGSPSLGYEGVPSTGSSTPTTTPSGARFVLFDLFFWGNPITGGCGGSGTSISFLPGTCAAQQAASLAISGQVRWSPAEETGPFVPTRVSQITFTATPEPSSFALAATGLFAIGSVIARRRRSNALQRRARDSNP